MSKTIHTSLGIELGSTRIKAVLIDEDCRCVAKGEYGWENRFENGVWTYSLDDAWEGLRTAVARLFASLREPVEVDAMGLSGMMHGYLVFDKDGNQLVPFRTWRNTTTGKASNILTELFSENIPQRWSVAHLYQAVLQEEDHVKDVRSVNSLAGYIHRKLTGENVIGIGEASGMFPIDFITLDYRQSALEQFDTLVAPQGYPWKTKDIFPDIRLAGENAGVLSAEGARLIDPSGTLKPGIPLAPPEGGRGHRDGGNQQRNPAPGKRIGGDLRLFPDRVREAPQPRLFADRNGGDARGKSRRTGASQQLHLRYRRVGGPVSKLRRPVRS